MEYKSCAWKIRVTAEENEKFTQEMKSLRITWNRQKYIKQILFSDKRNTDNTAGVEEALTKEELFIFNKIGVNINQIAKKINATDERFLNTNDLNLLNELKEMLLGIINKRQKNGS